MSLVERLVNVIQYWQVQNITYGRGNLNELYNMEGRPLDAVHEERDLGIMINTDLKCSKQCLNAVKAAKKYSEWLKEPLLVNLRKLFYSCINHW